MMQWVRENLVAVTKDPTFVKQFTLAMEEALVNVIKYAYQHPPGLLEIESHFEKGKGEISFTLRDEGFPFNPLLHSSPREEGGIEERKEGGLGIFFMKKMTDSISYKRDQERNILILTKHLTKSV